VLDWLQQQVGARPEEFHGTAYVTPSLEQDSAIVAKVVTTSNWVDAVGNFNLLLFANGIANPIGWINTRLLTGILLKFDKEVYTSVARGRKENRMLTYAVAMICMLLFTAANGNTASESATGSSPRESGTLMLGLQRNLLVTFEFVIE
jgi:hypothetical protein